MGASIGRFGHDDGLLAASAAAGRALLDCRAWDGVAVVIGRGGKPEVEVSLAAVERDGVPLLRRAGGGCAVVLDPGNVLVSVAWPLPGLGAIRTGFAVISAWLAAGLAALGLPGVAQRGVSDLAHAERKLGGSCIHRSKGMLHYAATLLVDPDLDLIERYLPHPPREPDYRRGRTHRAFLTSLASAGLDLPPARAAAALRGVLDPAALILPPSG